MGFFNTLRSFYYYGFGKTRRDLKKADEAIKKAFSIVYSDKKSRHAVITKVYEGNTDVHFAKINVPTKYVIDITVYEFGSSEWNTAYKHMQHRSADISSMDVTNTNIADALSVFGNSLMLQQNMMETIVHYQFAVKSNDMPNMNFLLNVLKKLMALGGKLDDIPTSMFRTYYDGLSVESPFTSESLKHLSDVVLYAKEYTKDDENNDIAKFKLISSGPTLAQKQDNSMDIHSTHSTVEKDTNQSRISSSSTSPGKSSVTPSSSTSKQDPSTSSSTSKQDPSTPENRI